MAAVTARRLAEVRAQEWNSFHELLNRNTERFYGVPAAGTTP